MSSPERCDENISNGCSDILPPISSSSSSSSLPAAASDTGLKAGDIAITTQDANPAAPAQWLQPCTSGYVMINPDMFDDDDRTRFLYVICKVGGRVHQFFDFLEDEHQQLVQSLVAEQTGLQQHIIRAELEAARLRSENQQLQEDVSAANVHAQQLESDLEVANKKQQEMRVTLTHISAWTAFEGCVAPTAWERKVAALTVPLETVPIGQPTIVDVPTNQEQPTVSLSESSALPKQSKPITTRKKQKSTNPVVRAKPKCGPGKYRVCNQPKCSFFESTAKRINNIQRHYKNWHSAALPYRAGDKNQSEIKKLTQEEIDERRIAYRLQIARKRSWLAAYGNNGCPMPEDEDSKSDISMSSSSSSD